MALGLPAGISPHPLGVEATPERRTPFWARCLVVSGLVSVRSTSLLLASLLRRLNWVSGITAPVIPVYGTCS
jgi:hypothetical protein